MGGQKPGRDYRQVLRPLATNAVALCGAAEATLNANGGHGLDKPYVGAPIDEAAVARMRLDEGGDRPATFTRLTIDGRKLAAVTFVSPGTCESSEIQIWKGDLTAQLAPDDHEHRNPLNDGSDGALFGADQEVVDVMGQPLVRTYNGGDRAYLSVIDGNGDLVPTCQIDREPVEKPVLRLGDGEKVCHAILNGSVERVPTKKPSPSQSIAPLSEEEKRLLLLNSNDSGVGGTTDYTLREVANADLDNTGHVQAIGMVGYEYSSGAGCGSGNAQVAPVFLDGKGNADLHDPRNQDFFDRLPSHISSAYLARFEGKTYIALAPTDAGPPQEVWKLTSKGGDKICAYELYRVRVRPISDGVR